MHAVTEPKAGDCILVDGVPVRLDASAASDADGEDWWATVLFAKPEKRMVRLNRHTKYSKLHRSF